MNEARRPLLLVDVDGVLSLWGFEAGRPPVGEFVNVDGIVHFISREACDHLRALTAVFQLAWCTGWEEKANEHLVSLLGVTRPLPVISLTGSLEPGNGDHWKLAAIDRWAAPDRPLAWIDDTHDATCHRWAARRAAATLLIATEPHRGLTADHAANLRAWAATLADAGRT